MPRATRSAEKSARAAKASTATKKAPAAGEKTAVKKAAVKKAPAKKPAVKKAPTAVKKSSVAKKAPAAKKAAVTKAPAVRKAAAKVDTRKRVPKPVPVKPAKLDAFQTSQRAELLAERATYERQANSLQAEADLLAAEREPGDVQFDEESGEGDTLAVERERDLALSAQARSAVDEIDSALARLNAGTYGICERCGQKIPKERLKALPHAALCVTCKSGGLGRL